MPPSKHTVIMRVRFSWVVVVLQALVVAAASLVGAALAGCSLPVYSAAPLPPEHTGPIEDAWGLRVEPVEAPECAVVLHAMERGQKCQGADGKPYDGCQRKLEVWCQPGTGCAHEVGHVAGLGHVNDNANVMHRFTADDTTETTPEQRRRVRALAAGLRVCQEAQR